jgi:hypothetical protein
MPHKERIMPAPNDLLSSLLGPVVHAVTTAINAAYDAGGAETAKKVSAAIGRSLQPSPAPRQFHLQSAAHAAYASALATPTFASPQKRGAQNRVAPGVVKKAVHRVIKSNPEGISRDGVRKLASDIMGQQIKEGSLKQSLRLLTKSSDIENRDRLWFPTRNGGQSND